MSDLHQKISILYRKVETANAKFQTSEKRLSISLKILQKIIDNPQQSGILAQQAIDSLELGIIILHKISPESSPDYDSWSIRSLSYKTAKKYFSDWECTYNYEVDIHGNDLHSLITHDEEVFKRTASKMIQVSENRWEYIGHARDLVTD